MRQRGDIFALLSIFTTMGAFVLIIVLLATPTARGLAGAVEGSSRLVGAGLTVCLGGGFALLFALLSWRNHAGAKAEERHAELLEAQRK